MTRSAVAVWRGGEICAGAVRDGVWQACTRRFSAIGAVPKRRNARCAAVSAHRRHRHSTATGDCSSKIAARSDRAGRRQCLSAEVERILTDIQRRCVRGAGPGRRTSGAASRCRSATATGVPVARQLVGYWRELLRATRFPSVDLRRGVRENAHGKIRKRT